MDVSFLEAQQWLQSMLKQITNELSLTTKEQEENLSPDMLEYMAFTQQVVYRGIERELAEAEKKHKKKHPLDKVCPPTFTDER